VEEHPGIHLRRIERETGLPLGQVLYHLDRLERMGLVRSVRDAGFRRYFSPTRVPRQERPLVATLWHAVPRRIVETLVDGRPRAHKELQAIAGVAGSTLTFHLQRMIASGVLEPQRDGAATRYRLRDVELAKRELEREAQRTRPA
jgi:predicted transcriptional regulator